jgi:hypothetical protein
VNVGFDMREWRFRGIVVEAWETGPRGSH